MYMLLSVYIPALMREIGAHNMTRATIFTDNCGKQFKCKFHFGWVADSGVKVCDNDGQPTEKNVHLEHHYFGACREKNISDSEGGVTKTYARNKATNMSWRVTGPRDLCAKLGMDLDFKLREATDEEREIFYADPTHVRRSGQILMTKVCVGEHYIIPCGVSRFAVAASFEPNTS